MKRERNNLKRIISKICLSAAIILSAVTISSLMKPSQVYAAEDGTITISDTITVTISEGGTKATFSGTGTIPRIVTTGTPLINGYGTIETVVVEEGITSLGTLSFNKFSALKSISLPQSLTSIQTNSFQNCTSLTEITIPKNVTSAQALFKNSNLTTITFEEGMTKLPIYVCEDATKLTTVNLPSTLTEISTAAFKNTTSLKEIVIPKNVNTINTSAFSGTGLTTITFEDGMTKIPNNACKGATNLTTVNIPDSVTSLGYYIFEDCTSLKEITIPKSVTTAVTGVNYTLGNSSIEIITFEDGMTKIPAQICGKATKLTTVNIPESVVEISNNAFTECTSLVTIKLPSKLEKIGNYTFNGCKSLENVSIPKGVTSIGVAAFGGTAIKEITIPKNVTTASTIFGGNSNGWDDNNSLQKITFEAGMETIPAKICENCVVLTEITIPDSVTSIPSSAFMAETETPTKVKTVNTYATGLNWATLFNRIVTFIDPSAFQEGLTMTGTVSPITTIDITIPLDAFQFRIDEERNLEVQTTEIVNNSQYPLEIYILNVEATNNEPNIVAKDTFTDKQWNNLSVSQTLSNIAISLNDKELHTVFNNTELDNSLATKVGDLKSGYAEAQILEITPDVQYGKAFIGADEITLLYRIVFEVTIP